MSNLTTASGGAITGNYDAAGIELIGFRFFSATELPSSVHLELGGTTTSFQTIFYPSVTGVWQTFAASLQSVELGGWTNLLGPVKLFVSPNRTCAMSPFGWIGPAPPLDSMG